MVLYKLREFLKKNIVGHIQTDGLTDFIFDHFHYDFAPLVQFIFEFILKFLYFNRVFFASYFQDRGNKLKIANFH